MLIVAFLLQAAAPSVPEKHSVLVPVGAQPCVRKGDKDEVVVCADPLPAQALPLPNEAISTRPVAVNRDLTGISALNAEDAPCATVVGGCSVGLDILGMGVAAVRGVQKLVAPGSCCEREGEATNPFLLVGDAVKGAAKAGKHKPDRTKRVAIDLEDPVLAGRVHP